MTDLKTSNTLYWAWQDQYNKEQEAQTLKLLLYKGEAVFKRKHDNKIVPLGRSGNHLEFLREFTVNAQESIKALSGQFAIVLWNPGSGQLIAITDHLASIPIYIRRCPENVTLSFSLNQILRKEDFSMNNISKDSLLLLFNLNFPRETRTYFKSINRVPASSVMYIGESVHKTAKYWIPGSNTVRGSKNASEYMQELDNLIRLSVKSHTPDYLPAVLISGGIDSTAIAYYVNQQQADKKLITLTGVYDDLNMSEEISHLRQVVKHLELEDHYFNCTTSNLFSENTGLAMGPQSPIWSDKLLVDKYINFLVNRGVTEVHSGIGFDNLFSGMSNTLTELIADRNFIDAFKQVVQVEQKTKAAQLLSLFKAFTRQILFQNSKKYATRKNAIPEYLQTSAKVRSRYLLDNLYQLPADNVSEGKYRHHLELLNLKLGHTLQLNSELYSERGLFFRAPLLDKALLDFFWELPCSLMFYNNQSKFLFRQVLNGKLPSNVVQRPKFIVSDMPKKGLESNAYYLNRLSHDMFLSDLGLVDEKAFRICLNHEMSESSHQFSTTLFLILCSEDWIRRYFS